MIFYKKTFEYSITRILIDSKGDFIILLYIGYFLK